MLKLDGGSLTRENEVSEESAPRTIHFWEFCESITGRKECFSLCDFVTFQSDLRKSDEKRFLKTEIRPRTPVTLLGRVTSGDSVVSLLLIHRQP